MEEKKKKTEDWTLLAGEVNGLKTRKRREKGEKGPGGTKGGKKRSTATGMLAKTIAM